MDTLPNYREDGKKTGQRRRRRKASKKRTNQLSKQPSVAPSVGNGSRTSSRGSQVVGQLNATQGPVAEVGKYLAEYLVLPDRLIIVAAAWIVASWMSELWDRFPHLAITSPEKRCGKTRFLQLTEGVVPKPYNTTNISPAALYRLVEQEQPTLLIDEAQSIVRRSSEASEVLREILNAGIDSKAVIIRCGGKRGNELHKFHIYSPKVIALIGQLDSVLADRCLPVELRRKTNDEPVTPYRSRVVKPKAEKISKMLEKWAKCKMEEVKKVYDLLESFSIENDRMAELLLPLQAVLTVGGKEFLPELELYARKLEQAEAESNNQTLGITLLNACREIFGKKKNFLPTAAVLGSLVHRNEESWYRLNSGSAITAEKLANLLRPYGVKPDRKQQKINGKPKTERGYYRDQFTEAWLRYLPPESLGDSVTRLP